MRKDAEETEVRRQAIETAKFGVSLHQISSSSSSSFNLEERGRAHSLTLQRGGI